ncbi:hypothetical protein RD110_22365 [Rhodoferax koreense]|uniref:DUF1989 domain-containing protein n=1 Tax=Rhodoferax koreensis TaxID=1842727 RepID=A0A1P8K0Z9_9BURK|nr:urea carboxylase-associated family protein [Rhodoferax koreense]APW39611.1 hypothetical protein RD110_22365 [Rhodoferax koreense]
MLLTIDPPSRAPTARRDIQVMPGQAGSIVVLQGQLLKITALGAGAVASVFGFVHGEPSTFLSVHHTRVFSNAYVLGAGMRLVTNRRRALMVLGKDTVGTHDLLMPASTSGYLQEIGLGPETGCVEAVQAELQRLGIMPPRLPDPVNLFMHVRLHQDGRLEPLPNRVVAGDHVVCRVLRDTTFVVAACCTGIAGNDRPAPLMLSAAEDLSEL